MSPSTSLARGADARAVESQTASMPSTYATVTRQRNTSGGLSFVLVPHGHNPRELATFAIDTFSKPLHWSSTRTDAFHSFNTEVLPEMPTAISGAASPMPSVTTMQRLISVFGDIFFLGFSGVEFFWDATLGMETDIKGETQCFPNGRVTMAIDSDAVQSSETPVATILGICLHELSHAFLNMHCCIFHESGCRKGCEQVDKEEQLNGL